MLSKTVKPAVSVILPVYNAEKTVGSTLQSLADQTLKNIEIICIDDGSTDGSLSVLSDFQKKHPDRFIVISERNLGAQKARSAGVLQAKGEYVTFCDADDTMSAIMCEAMYENALKTNSDIVVCGYSRVSNGVATPEMCNKPQRSFAIDGSCGWLASVNTSLWNKLIRTEIAKSGIVVDRPPRITEDTLFLLSIYPLAKSLSFLPKDLYRYNADNSSAMTHLLPGELDGILEAWVAERRILEESSNWFLPIYDFAAFVHLGVSLSLVAVKSNSKHEAKRVHDLIRVALNDKFPLYKTGLFSTLKYAFDNRDFIARPYFARLLYSANMLLPALRCLVWARKFFPKRALW